VDSKHRSSLDLGTAIVLTGALFLIVGAFLISIDGLPRLFGLLIAAWGTMALTRGVMEMYRARKRK